MALTLVVEDGTGLANANSYATRAEGDSYHDGHLYATDWTGATDATKDAALVMATRLLDEHVRWTGVKAERLNALQWPRHSVRDRAGYSVDSNVVPTEVKNATAELARLLIASDRTAETDDRGFKRLKAGSLELEVDKFDRKGVLTDVVARMLEPMGTSVGSGFKLLRA